MTVNMANQNPCLHLFRVFFVFTVLGLISQSCIPVVPTSTATPTPQSIVTETPHSGFYYVSPSGEDTNPGTSEKPWRTIQNAANKIAAGDTVTILAGNYDERVIVERSGYSSAPIIFQAQGTVVMSGFTVYANDITILGFEITNTPDSGKNGVGIFVQGSSCNLENNFIHYATRGGITLFANPETPSQTSDCTVRNNRLYRNGHHGILVTGQNHLIEGNEVWGTIQYHPNWAHPPSTADADGIRFFGSGHIFRRNYIHDISLNDPENINPHIDAFQTWDEDLMKAGSNCIFEKNRIVLGRGTAGFQLAGGTHDLLIRNNIVKASAGIRSYKIDQSPYTSPSNLFVFNNLFIGDLAYTPNDGPVGITIQDTTNIVVQNNVLMDQPAKVISLSGSSEIEVNYNIAYNNDGSSPATPIGIPSLDNLWGINPLFVNQSDDDFHLQNGSPAIDAGGFLNDVNDDFDGALRPQGIGYDIGPYEYNQH